MFQVRIEDHDGRVLLWGPKFDDLWAACKESARRNEEYPIPDHLKGIRCSWKARRCEEAP
jgi:hypothetical protein